MTQNQLAFHANKERERANRASELIGTTQAEAARSQAQASKSQADTAAKRAATDVDRLSLDKVKADRDFALGIANTTFKGVESIGKILKPLPVRGK